MLKSCIYYTDFNADLKILNICQRQLENSFSGEIISVSLNKPLNFGKNIVLENEKRSYPTMVMQIIMGLEASTADYVFYTEADVLYHKSHFDFIPEKDDIFYYNINNWRWDYPKDRYICYNNLISLSMMCCDRELAINHYLKRLEIIKSKGLNKIISHEPQWVRKMGYEPGTKGKNKRFETWKSEYPNIDIRHNKTFSPKKVRIEDFKHKPNNWQETTMENISGWNKEELYGLIDPNP